MTQLATQTIDQDEVISAADEAQAKELKGMFEAGVHFGSARSRRHPKMEPYIFGIRNNVEVFDLAKVKAKLDLAAEFVRKLGSEHKVVVFVGTKLDIADLTEKAAKEAGMPYARARWIGGLISNFPSIKKRMDHYEDLKAKQASGELEKYTKKEQLEISREITKLAKNFGGLVALKKLPDALIVIDPMAEDVAVAEAKGKRIPVIGVVNSDSDPELVTYPIPANDSSRTSVDFILTYLAKAYQEGLASIVAVVPAPSAN
ncbi:MAG: 30S ribosomal protein S2 [Candidatus Niyogibacteria bacterium]|nr:30S ribosomal protein S2 [Candidatus Niyogibacteria bacterium]